MLAPRVQRKCLPDLGSAEPEGALVLRHLVVRACADGANLCGACYMNVKVSALLCLYRSINIEI